MKVYYNKSCSICRAEINHYKKQNIEEIDWIDIKDNVAAKKETLKDDKALLRRLHVKKDGKIFSGAKAFLLVWKNIPKYKFLYSILRLPLIFQIFSLTYEVVAFFLYLINKKQIKTN
jgi:predicted DCC family thiol-disulfide oxidoreductase YuxK